MTEGRAKQGLMELASSPRRVRLSGKAFEAVSKKFNGDKACQSIEFAV